jgi:lipopolysaccharide transport system ATP-binding protein
MKPIIRVTNLSKHYFIGAQRAAPSNLRETVTGAVRSPLKSLRRKSSQSTQPFWALKDVSFDVEPGEVVGIVGRNGAGKSTLLKILSRITEPTAGRVELYGKVGSLLEVGTGFHPELSGRENIYLNGSILGMSRAEIERKFDEIVAFSEIEKFLETPVKRYSSGMYVRLAFAVAAHLEPEILIVDEVLAVGDANFQKKCLGKMGEVATQGRTVLYVSHGLQSVKTLCSRAMILEEGRIKLDGPTNETLAAYTGLLRPKTLTNEALRDRMNRTSGAVRFVKVTTRSEEGAETWDHRMGSTIRLDLAYEVFEDVPSLGIYLAIKSGLSNEILTTFKDVVSAQPLRAGHSSVVTIEIPSNCLRPGDYPLYICLGDKKCEKFYDVVDENVALPELHIFSDEKDVHRRVGYFSIAAQLAAE